MFGASFLQRARHPSWPQAQCEDRGLALSWQTKRQVQGSWDTATLDRVATKIGLNSATSNETSAPVAVWHLGATVDNGVLLAPRLSKELGVPVRRDGLSLKLDAVFLDDSVVHAEHPGYEAAVLDGLRLGCVWRDLKPLSLDSYAQAKESLLEKAIENRQNVVIANACSSTDRCLSSFRKMMAAGYVNHIVVVEDHDARVSAGASAANAGQSDDTRESFARLSRETNGKSIRLITNREGARAPMVMARHDGQGAEICDRFLGGCVVNAVEKVKSRIVRWGPIVFAEFGTSEPW